jgi:hypothetical protein
MTEVRDLRQRLKWPLPSALVVVAAACLSVGVVLNIGGLTAVGVFAAIVGGLLILDALGISEPILRPPDPARVRVKRLTDSLAESTKVIAEIEKEVKARSDLVERLEADEKRHRELLALSRAEVEAVAQTLRTEVSREGRRSMLVGLLINAVFFGLGIVVTLLLT